MELTITIAFALGAYLLGSVPTAYLVVRIVRGADIRELGSRNVGAFNAYKQVGPWGGVLVLLADTAKGVLAVVIPRLAGADDWTLFATTSLIVAGHNWPVSLNFRGGKGAASILGISLALMPVLTVIAVVPGLLAMRWLRNFVLGAALGMAILNALLLVTGQDGNMIALCVFLTLIVTVTYLVSIRRHITMSVKARQWRELFMEMAA